MRYFDHKHRRVKGPSLFTTAFIPVVSNKPDEITKDFEWAHNWPSPKAKSTAKDPAATPPKAKSLVTFTGSVTVPVITIIATKAEPIPRTRAMVLSAT